MTTRPETNNPRDDSEPEVKPEVIEDLDATDEEAQDVRGGVCAAPGRAATAQTKTL
jgi:hypothetical protein